MPVNKSKSSALNQKPLKQVGRCLSACILMILCTSCSHQVDEEEMIKEYVSVVWDACGCGGVRGVSQGVSHVVSQEECFTNTNKVLQTYSVVPECGRYKKVNLALMDKCLAENIRKNIREYDKDYCEGKVKAGPFSNFFSEMFCDFKYTEHYRYYEKLAVKCICDHWDAYKASNLSDYEKETFYGECKERGYL